MKTPYVPHLFGADALAKVQGRFGWLTVGVASSIAWPEDDVWIEYDAAEYFLHGANKEGDHRTAPCISTPTDKDHLDDALSRLYRFTSVLGFYKRGYVDITGRVWGTRMVRYGNPRDTFTTLLQGGAKSFSCNHMPLIEDDQLRIALAFLREGRRLQHVHQSYSFLSFFKVIESQFGPKGRVEWVEANLDLLLEEHAVKRIAELRAQGVNVNRHLFDSGRCAVAHASVGGNIVDPDIPDDRKRIASDLDIISALANRYVRVEARLPDEMDLYDTRDRVAPWHVLMEPAAVASLRAGGHVENVEDLGKLNGGSVLVRLWPDPPPKQFEVMTLFPVESHAGAVKLMALSSRGTVVLAFLMDVANGRMHTLLDEGGLRAGVEVSEEDIEDYTRYFHSVVGNRTVELAFEGTEPVDCDVIIPVNIIARAPEDAVAEALEAFRKTRQRGSTSGEAR